jgi:Na+/melibiose symporter-like transporter
MMAFAVAWKYPLTSERHERIHQWIQRRNVRLQVVP